MLAGKTCGVFDDSAAGTSIVGRVRRMARAELLHPLRSGARHKRRNAMVSVAFRNRGRIKHPEDKHRVQHDRGDKDGDFFHTDGARRAFVMATMRATGRDNEHKVAHKVRP